MNGILETMERELSSSKFLTKTVNESPTSTAGGNNSKIMDENDKRNGAVVYLWKTVAAAVKLHIEKHSDVNQSANISKNVEHDLTACRKVLLFPFVLFPDVNSKIVWSKWADLYR